MFLTIYTNLCSKGKLEKENWQKGSGLHRHHIVPLHCGGEDTEENVTYLTVKAHIVAHYLLWRIYRKINDLRAMHMLGAKLTPEQRRITGKWCRDNKIGFFSDRWTREERASWTRRGIATQMQRKVGIFDPQTRPGYASLGGKRGARTQKERGTAIFDSGKRPYYAHLGGISHCGKVWIHNKEGKITRCKKEDLPFRLENGWEIGMRKAKIEMSKSKWMHTEEEEKKVPNEEVQHHQEMGWKLGRNPKVGSKISRTKRSSS